MAKKKAKSKKRKLEKNTYELTQESIDYLLDLHKLQGVVLVNLRNQIGAIKPDDLISGHRRGLRAKKKRNI